MSASNEQKIIKQYHALIRALIPYEQDNRLLEGLNKFTGRVPSHVRKIIRDEVTRLSCLTDAPADNSAFAQFPVFKFSHFGIQMCLDKVGASILHKESELYQDRYTVGVFETITNSEFYQQHIKKENFKKIVDAFTIETQSLDDIHFGDDIAIAPNFPISCPEYEKGRNCTIASLGYKRLALESKRPPKVTSGDVFKFQFPDEVPGLPKGMTANYMVSAVKFNKHTEKYETHFKLHPTTDPRVKAYLEKYINMASFQQPLQRELECERAMQDLERDRIMENSPWVPIFVKRKKNGVVPTTLLFTKTNKDLSGDFPALQVMLRKKLFPRAFTELKRYGEVFIVSGLMQTKKGDCYINATLRELENCDLVAPLLHLLNKSDTIQCLQCRLTDVTKDDKDKAFAIHDLSRTDNDDLNQITNIIYCKNVTESVRGLVLTEKRAVPPLPEDFVDDFDSYGVDMVMEEDLDRRSESRYLMEKDGTVKTGLLTSVPVKIKDLSSKGMRIAYLEPPGNQEKMLRVSVPELKIKNQVYEVINYNPETLEVRLKLPTKKDTIASGISQFVNKNYAFFKSRDLALVQRNTHRFIWELAVRHHPSASILCTTNRYLLNRLKTVYQTPQSDDLYPFSQIENVVPMHGFFADREADKPKSKILVDMFRGALTSIGVVHCVRNTDNKLVFLPEQDYMYGNMRKLVQKHMEESKVSLCVTRVDVNRCRSATTPMTKKRLAQLSRIDKPMYDRFSVMQSSYTHVLYLTSESVLHSTIMAAALRPVKQQVEGEKVAQA